MDAPAKNRRMGIEDRDWYREVLRRRDGLPPEGARRHDPTRGRTVSRAYASDGMPGWVAVVIGLVVVCGGLMVLFKMFLR